MHKFDSLNYKKLNSEERYRLMPPKLFVNEIEKRVSVYLNRGETATVVDVGCGSGFFLLPLAKRLKDKNILLVAMDINEKMLDIFNDNLKKELIEKNFLKVKSLKCEEYSIPLSNSSANIIILANVFHEIEDKLTYLQEIKRVLKEGGVLFILDWRKEDLSPAMGSPSQERISTEYAVEILNNAGFIDIKTVPLYPSSFTIVSKRTKKII